MWITCVNALHHHKSKLKNPIVRLEKMPCGPAGPCPSRASRSDQRSDDWTRAATCACSAHSPLDWLRSRKCPGKASSEASGEDLSRPRRHCQRHGSFRSALNEYAIDFYQHGDRPRIVSCDTRQRQDLLLFILHFKNTASGQLRCRTLLLDKSYRH